MAEPKFATQSFRVWRKDDYSKKFTMERTTDIPSPFWVVRDSSGKVVGQGLTTNQAQASLAEHLNVKKDEIKRARKVYECRKDGVLVYRIHAKGDGFHIFDSNDAPVGNRTFDTYTKARSYCVEILS